MVITDITELWETLLQYYHTAQIYHLEIISIARPRACTCNQVQLEMGSLLVGHVYTVYAWVVKTALKNCVSIVQCYHYTYLLSA